MDLSGDEQLSLPDAFAGRWGVVLFNRGAWCSSCTAQLRAFERARAELHELDAEVVSLSVDDETTTRELVAQNQLTFPVGHGADAHRLSELTGAFVNPDPVYVQATGFVLDPDGRVVVSAYSSGAIGRIIAADAVGLLRHLQQR